MSSASDPVVVSFVTNVVGVDDRGLDPSVVALTNADGATCSGVLLAADVVLTARTCVTSDATYDLCSSLSLPAPLTVDPRELTVYTGVPSDGALPVSVGASVVTPNASTVCGADIASVVLARPVSAATPTVVSESGVAQGGYVRTVAFGWPPSGSPPESELLREHVPVLDVTDTEFAVGEASCVGSAGAVAFDEATGEVVGVLSRWGTPCGAAAEFDVYTRVDAFYSLVEDSLAWGPSLAVAEADGGAAGLHDAGKAKAAHAKKPLTDMGAACATANDCGAGVCVTAQGSQYCSETCTAADRCPADYRCVVAQGGASVCIQT